MPTSEELTGRQKLQWGRAAAGWERHYDWFERQSRELAGWLCDAAGLAPGQQVLDLACGSGQPAATAALRVRPGGRVTATDLSPEMVAVTRRTAERLGIDNLDAREMDMQALAFPDETFDAATCRFGLMFCPEPVRAASEVRRVLKPGGRFALAVWDEPAKNPFFSVMAGVVERVRAGAAARSRRARPVPARAAGRTCAGPWRRRILDRRASRRARSCSSTSRSTRTWRLQTELAAPLRAAMEALGPDEIARLKTAVFDEIAPFVEGGRVRGAGVTLCARAVR